MHQDQLITGESFLINTDNGPITLTTHWIRYNNKIWGQSNIISIMLEKISAIQILYISHPGLGIGGLLMIMLGVALSLGDTENGWVITIAVITGILLIVAYYITMKHICVITSDGSGKIVFRTEGMDTDALIDMADKVELAKHNRLMELKG
ncbi:MAG: hypothetical protein JWR38_5292 [Mucilaginibacter sp.]|nr:hypothetical protein [Mucilaginibacter sp.]